MQTINRFFYGPTPEERVRAWQTKLRGESRRLDQEMRQLDLATNKARQTVKQLASKGDVKSARILAKEVVRSNRQKDRLSVSKARLGSIGIQLTQQMGTPLIQNHSLKLIANSPNSDAESDRISPEVDGNHETIKCTRKTSSDQSDNAGNEYGDDQGQNPEIYLANYIQTSVQAGILDEMLQDTLDMEEDEELEEEADTEVDKVLFELTDGKLGEAGKVGTSLLTSRPLEQEETEQDMEKYRQQLNALLS
ncbi:hypothetical protein C0992_000577 [Termitomyces sp. T32_za158]|nr:hypothetical protein C0992_000577 [Termitomyces sp. T32_za158]